MAKNLPKTFDQTWDNRWTNATGEDVVSGELVDAGLPHKVVALQDIANGASGMVRVYGRATLKKGTGYTLAQGQLVYEDLNDSGNVKAWTAGVTTKPCGRVAVAAATGDTTVGVDLGDVAPRFFSGRRAATAGEDTANVALVAHGLGGIPTFFMALIASTGNVIRVPQGAVTADGTHVSVADSGLAVNEMLIVVAML